MISDRRETREVPAPAGADDPDAVLRPLLRAPAGKATFVRRREAAWDRPWVGLLFLGALFIEWWMRRR